MCGGVAKHVSAGVAPFNMVGFVKIFELPLRDKFRALSTSAKVATIAVVSKREFHRVTPLSEKYSRCFS